MAQTCARIPTMATRRIFITLSSGFTTRLYIQKPGQEDRQFVAHLPHLRLVSRIFTTSSLDFRGRGECRRRAKTPQSYM